MAEEEAHISETVYRKKQKQNPKCESSHSAWHIVVWSSGVQKPSHHSVLMAQITDNFSTNQTITRRCEDSSVLCWRAREVSLFSADWRGVGWARLWLLPSPPFPEDLGLPVGLLMRL